MKKSKKIDMRGILPRYPIDEIPFIVEKLAEVEPCTIADLVRHLGGEPRSGAGPSAEYGQVHEALKRAQQAGKVTAGDRRGSWCVVRD